MELYFYSRISSATQSANRQVENFQKFPNFNSQNLFIDRIQGNVPFMQRPEAIRMFDRLTDGEISEGGKTVIIDSIDRLGRNLLDILHTIKIFTDNGINIQSLKEGFQTIIDGKENPIAQIVVAVMGSIAEMERNRIRERTREGIKIAKAQGKFRGRKPGSVQSDIKLLKRHPVVVSKLKKGMSYRDIASITGKSTATVAKVKKVLEKRVVLN